MFSTQLLGVLSAVLSAVIWGIGDFAGGLAARRSNQYRVLAIAAVSGILVLLPLAIIKGEKLPEGFGMLWAAAAGVFGALGIGGLYAALSVGNAALVSPTAAVIGAAVPVLVGLVLRGLPGAAQLAGLATGMAGIWLVSAASSSSVSKKSGLGLAVLSGVGFGGFYVFIAQVQGELVFTPILVAKIAALVVALLAMGLLRVELLPLAGIGMALVAGGLDVGGNVFYLIAKQYTRFDVAAVLSSMYPASTIIMARFVQGENVSRKQRFGIAICLCAVALIAI